VFKSDYILLWYKQMSSGFDPSLELSYWFLLKPTLGWSYWLVELSHSTSIHYQLC